MTTATEKAGKLQDLPLDKITRDPRLQMRPGLNQKTVERYSELLSDGVSLPPAVIVTDGKKNWLAHGWHRDAASAKAGLGELHCEVRRGTFRDAWLIALGANQDNGLPRDDATIAKVMKEAFRDEEVRGWTDRRIATACGVSYETVRRWRKKLEDAATITPVTVREGADGRKINVSRIGKPETNGHTGGPTVTGLTVTTPENAGDTRGGHVLNPPGPDPDEIDDADSPDDGPEVSAPADDKKAKARGYLKAAEKSLAAMQDNCTQAQRSGAKLDVMTIGDLARRVHGVIENGRRSL